MERIQELIRVDATWNHGVIADVTVPPAVWRNKRRSSAISLAVLYRSDARFASAFWQIRSSSLGIVSSVCRGGRGSVVVICSMISSSESPRNGLRPVNNS